MKELFLFFSSLFTFITFSVAQNVGIGTTTPNAYGKLHVHNGATFDASISLTNGLTTDANTRGARFRMLNSDLNIFNYEATGKINLATGFNTRMTLDDAGNVGIGTITPSYRLHVLNTTASTISTIQTTAAGERAELQLLGDNNPFNTLFIQKYAPGAAGTFGGISKDNLSVISTGGNAGTLVIGTGDGVSPIVFVTGIGERMRVEGNGQVAIGTNTPASTGKLHIHDDIANQDVSLVMTNSLTGPNNLRGMRLRLLNSDVTLINYEATGKINFATAFNTRMTIDNAGNVGIGTTTPTNPLHIVTASAADAVLVNASGSNVSGISSINNIGNNTTGLLAGSSANGGVFNYIVGVRGFTGNGGTTIIPSYNVGVIGESLNQTRGVGVLASSNSPSASKTDGALVAINWYSGNDAYGIIGSTNGSTGAGILGTSQNSGTIGVQGYGYSNGSTAFKGEILAGLSGTALELANGSIKVSGVSRPVFQITTSAGNISGNTVNIPLGTQANTPTDMLVVTPVFTGTYLNKPIGVWWNGSNWTIFTQDLSAMPVGVVFNVLVVKQ
jgi:hypothetical protein